MSTHAKTAQVPKSVDVSRLPCPYGPWVESPEATWVHGPHDIRATAYGRQVPAWACIRCGSTWAQLDADERALKPNQRTGADA